MPDSSSERENIMTGTPAIMIKTHEVNTKKANN